MCTPGRLPARKKLIDRTVETEMGYPMKSYQWLRGCSYTTKLESEWPETSQVNDRSLIVIGADIGLGLHPTYEIVTDPHVSV